MPERVHMMDCGDAIRRADNGSWGKGPIAKTASYTVKTGDTGTIFTNTGAAGAVTFTLPAARKGLWFTFLKPVAQNVSILASGGAKINGGTANKRWENTATEPEAVTSILCDGINWVILNLTGSWVNNNT